MEAASFRTDTKYSCMNDMNHYFIVENDRQLGPFTVEDLKSKMLRKSTLVWADGMIDWASADSIDELKKILISDPPPHSQRPSPPPHNTPQQHSKSPQQPLSINDFLSGSGGMFIGAIGVIIFSLLNWVDISFWGFSIKFSLFSLSKELDNSFFREVFKNYYEITLIRIVVVILVISLVLSFALLIISLVKPQSQNKSVLAYCGFGICAIVTVIFIVAMIFVSNEIEHWIMTVFPFLTLGTAIISMIFFVKQPMNASQEIVKTGEMKENSPTKSCGSWSWSWYGGLQYNE